MLEELCRRVEEMPLSNEALFNNFDFPDDLPWAEKLTDDSNCYACLHALAREMHPRKILEIGTGFGLSTAALAAACDPLELLVTLDLGIFGEQVGYRDNIEVARAAINDERVRFHRVNTRAIGGDNQGAGEDVPYWQNDQELKETLLFNEFDVLFIDGKHTDDGLLNDLLAFWRCLRRGGLVICDDMHDPADYPPGRFDWLGDTWRSYHFFLGWVFATGHYVWKFPFVPSGQRPMGLILK